MLYIYTAQINENQELLDDWMDEKRKQFCFFGTKFNVVKTFGERYSDQYIVCRREREICIGAQLKSIWIVVYGKGRGKRQSMKSQNIKFKSAIDAYKKLHRDICDPLVEAGV